MKLLLTPVINSDSSKMMQAYEVAKDISTEHENLTLRVPRFFQYDGASIPSIAWQLVGTPFNPRFMLAAVFHDWLYHTHQIERRAADRLFRQLLQDSQVDEGTTDAMCRAVRLAGGGYWKNDADDRDYLERLTLKIENDGRDPADYGLPALP
jgi:hypothetical protein